MADVFVNEMRLVEKKPVIIKLHETRSVFMYTFLVTDVTSLHLPYSIAVASSQVLESKTNKLQNLGAKAELYIVQTVKDELLANNAKKMLVIELTDYPYIGVYVDYRDQTVLNGINDNDTFGCDVVRLWSNQTPKDIPTIIVNLSNPQRPFTGLKLLPLN